MRDIGAKHICDSSQGSFQSDLLAAITETGATIAFDATGGGTLANDILTAMEQSLSAQNEAFSRYGSTVHKQVYLYGGLDTRPLTLHRTFGLSWGVNGWLMSHCLAKIGESRAAQLRERAASEIAITFASNYVAEI